MSSIEVVFIWLNVVGEQAGTVWGEFVANIVEDIDGSVFPWLDGQYSPFVVYPLLNGVCLACHKRAIRIIHHFHDNRVQWKFQCPPYEGVGLREPFVCDDQAQGVHTGHGLGTVRRLFCICHLLPCRLTARGECEGDGRNIISLSASFDDETPLSQLYYNAYSLYATLYSLTDKSLCFSGGFVHNGENDETVFTRDDAEPSF